MPSRWLVSIRCARGANFVFVFLACTLCCDETVWCSVTPARAVCVWYADLLRSHPFSGVRISMHMILHMAQVQSWCNHGLDMARFGSLLHALSTPPAPSPRSNHPHTPPTDLHHHPHAAQSPSAAIRLPLTTPTIPTPLSRHQSPSDSPPSEESPSTHPAQSRTTHH